MTNTHLLSLIIIFYGLSLILNVHGLPKIINNIQERKFDVTRKMDFILSRSANNTNLIHRRNGCCGKTCDCLGKRAKRSIDLDINDETNSPIAFSKQIAPHNHLFLPGWAIF